MNENGCFYLIQFFEYGLKALGSQVMAVEVCKEAKTVSSLGMRYFDLFQRGRDVWEGQRGPEPKFGWVGALQGGSVGIAAAGQTPGESIVTGHEMGSWGADAKN